MMASKFLLTFEVIELHKKCKSWNIFGLILIFYDDFQAKLKFLCSST